MKPQPGGFELWVNWIHWTCTAAPHLGVLLNIGAPNLMVPVMELTTFCATSGLISARAPPPYILVLLLLAVGWRLRVRRSAAVEGAAVKADDARAAALDILCNGGMWEIIGRARGAVV
jgi:hypothetical protein